jgi:cbb3-type cytochrome oxidase maturation protein
MESLYLLIPLGLIISLGAGVIFWWSATRGKQFEQLDQAARHIIFDNDHTHKLNPQLNRLSKIKYFPKNIPTKAANDDDYQSQL